MLKRFPLRSVLVHDSANWAICASVRAQSQIFMPVISPLKLIESQKLSACFLGIVRKTLFHLTRGGFYKKSKSTVKFNAYLSLIKERSLTVMVVILAKLWRGKVAGRAPKWGIGRKEKWRVQVPWSEVSHTLFKSASFCLLH